VLLPLIFLFTFAGITILATRDEPTKKIVHHRRGAGIISPAHSDVAFGSPAETGTFGVGPVIPEDVGMPSDLGSAYDGSFGVGPAIVNGEDGLPAKVVTTT
jgi:hypothetical protein